MRKQIHAGPLTSWSSNGLFGATRRMLALFLPEVPDPWHETEVGIMDGVGSGAGARERPFPMRVTPAREYGARL